MYFTYKYTKIYYEKYGNSKKVLLIFPGWGDNRKTFNKIINDLKEDFTIYIFDYPGFGNSNIPYKNLTIYDYAEIFIKFIKENKIKDPMVIGHSFGGRLIITMAGYYNIKFKKIVLISSAGIKPKKTLLQKIKQKIYKLLKKIEIIFPYKKRKKYKNFLLKHFASSDFLALPPTLHKTFINIVNEDLTKYLKNIKIETLIIWGENDESTPIKDAYKINKLIKSSGLIVIKSASHFCYLEYPGYIKVILDEYLKRGS